MAAGHHHRSIVWQVNCVFSFLCLLSSWSHVLQFGVPFPNWIWLLLIAEAGVVVYKDHILIIPLSVMMCFRYTD